MNKWLTDKALKHQHDAGQDEVAAFHSALVDCLVRVVGKHPAHASQGDWFHAVAHIVRGHMADAWLRTKGLHHQRDLKVVYYLSLEYLIGRSLKNHLYNLGLSETCRLALARSGIDLDNLCEQEPDAAFGNGGLGRLAACFLDSLTTLGYPAYGYGIRYDAGMFRQHIEDGWQVERPEDWLEHGNPWEFLRPRISYTVEFGGHLVTETDNSGNPESRWTATSAIMAVAYDLQVSGHGRSLVNSIRLWSAKSVDEFSLSHFNAGEHVEAVRNKSESEALSKVLYPDDSTPAGRELRLRQEYFFVSASLQDILARFAESHASFTTLPDEMAIQLNDTHPALAIPEMMRLLVDRYGLSWDEAWHITTRVFAYTNHTLLPEALETWPVALLERLLPRHLEVIYRINDQLLEYVRLHAPGDEALVQRVSLVGEAGERHIRMAHLAIAGSHKVNGVSALHTEIMRMRTFADFERLFPGRLVCKTNGITVRRWLNQANPRLADLISSRIGGGWLSQLEQLEQLVGFADDGAFQEAFRAIKGANKVRLANRLGEKLETPLDPCSLFDVEVKRIHEYKRQLLNLLHVIARYNRLHDGTIEDPVPRTVIFAGKAAAGYHRAKLIIKLINDVARTVNNDPVTKDFLKVVFVPDYGVRVAELIVPAADLSEQISTAGAEASGTGNMKLALNGALTIGTRDGANIEIGNAVGEENIFFFGLSADAVAERRSSGKYDPHSLYEGQDDLRRVLDMIRTGYFSPDDPGRFHSVVDSLIAGGDYFMLLADFASYVDCQSRVDASYRDSASWTRKAIINVARMGRFSSDRTIREYAEEIWNVRPLCLLPSGIAAE